MGALNAEPNSQRHVDEMVPVAQRCRGTSAKLPNYLRTAAYVAAQIALFVRESQPPEGLDSLGTSFRGEAFCNTMRFTRDSS